MNRQDEPQVQEPGVVQDNSPALQQGAASQSPWWKGVAFLYFIWIFYARITPGSSHLELIAASSGMTATLAAAIMVFGQTGIPAPVYRCAVAAIFACFTALALSDTLRKGWHLGPWLVPLLFVVCFAGREMLKRARRP